jgi:antitoxin component YwqK of YwqJK toxin-antitoxin module
MLTFEWRPHYVQSAVEYKDGIKHGKATIYDKNGKVLKEKTFLDGVEVGPDGKPKVFAP